MPLSAISYCIEKVLILMKEFIVSLTTMLVVIIMLFKLILKLLMKK